MSNSILKNIDTSWQIQRIFWIFFSRFPGRCHCNICGNSVTRFIPYRGGTRAIPPLMRELNVIGSDVDHFECPRCGAHDRERHLRLYFERAGLFKKIAGARVLHFAPEKYFSQLIQQAEPQEYTRADLYPTSKDIQKIDIQNLPFDSGSFDFVIANHVLEHVENDKTALNEICRVLMPGGNAILQTPFSNNLQKKLEDPGISSELARLHAYGQEDHRRLYGNNWVKNFEIPGLISNVQAHADVLSDIDPFINGVNAAEPFMWFRRNDK